MRLLGLIFLSFGMLALAVAAVAVAAEVVAVAGGGSLFGTPLGKVWFEFDRGSLLLLQPAIERHLTPWLWTDVVQPLLERAPLVTAAAFGLPGLFLVWLGRRVRRA